MSLRVAIFGGSFNPPHIGHQEICKWLLEGEGLVDLIWIVPCFEHPFGKNLASFKDRHQMCLFAFSKLGPKVVVSRVEEILGGVSHTIRTIKHLKSEYPDYRFSLVTGGDITKETKSWQEFDEVKDMLPIITVPRGPLSHIPDISSTEVRERISRGESIASHVPKEVAVYIVTHGLYR